MSSLNLVPKKESFTESFRTSALRLLKKINYLLKPQCWIPDLNAMGFRLAVLRKGQTVVSFSLREIKTCTCHAGSHSPCSTWKSSSVWDDFDKSVSTFVRNPHPRAAGILEVNKFNEVPLLPRTGNPLTWWFERRQVYPALFELAIRRLCIVATSDPCERVFSEAGQVVTEKRNRLTGKKVSQILFLNGNLYKLISGPCEVTVCWLFKNWVLTRSYGKY
jgi:hypothetical protein